MSDDKDTSAATAAAVALKLPSFYTHNPKFWFVFSENQFRLKHITSDETKFAYVVTSLTEDVAERVMRTLSDPPEKDKYGALKAHLLKEYTLSRSERAAALLDMPGLGDMKPSQLLTKMLALLPTDEAQKPGIIFHELFMRQLPADVRAHLTDKADLPLDKLAEEADRFFSTAGQRISAVRPAQPPRPAPPARAHSRAVPPHPRPAAVPKTPRPGAGTLCFYHATFGERAYRCRGPCDYTPEN